jgi:RNA polymerase sigma factor (sigma-70 family)
VSSIAGIHAAPPLEVHIALIDEEKFSGMVEPHWAAMVALARRLTNPSDADDVVQEALAVAWRKRSRFDPLRGTARAWLLALTADQCRKAWRRSKPATAPVEALALVGVESFVPDVDLQAAIHKLSSRQRLAVELYYFLRLSTAETATVMRCSEGTVKSALADARKRLRGILGDEYR